MTALGKVVGEANGGRAISCRVLRSKAQTTLIPKSDCLCPDQVEATVAGWKNRELAGVFFWKYDALTLSNSGRCGGTNSLAYYLQAVEQGMNKA